MSTLIKYNTILMLLVAVVFGSCRKALDQQPENAITNSNFWKNEKDVETAVNGLHGEFRSAMSQPQWLFLSLRGHLFDAKSTYYNNISKNKFYLYNDRNSANWSWVYLYQSVSTANLIIENVHRANLKKDRHDFYLGQAYAMRAYLYLHLIRYWGDVPLITKSVDVGEKARSPWQEVAEQAIKDAITATELLPAQNQMRDASGASIASRQNPGRGTAWATLAHLYAWKASLNNEPALLAKGIEAASKVIESGDYRLASSGEEIVTSVMRGNSTEGILEVDYRANVGDWITSGAFLPTLFVSVPVLPLDGYGNVRTKACGITNTLAKQLFPEINDQRRSSYFYKLDELSALPATVTGNRAFIQKWRGVLINASGQDQGRPYAYEDNNILLRLADIVLLRAEMRNGNGDTHGAIQDLDLIRTRVGASAYNATTEGTDLKNIIFREREKEMLLEDHRYFDAIRNKLTRQKLVGDFVTMTDQDIADGALYIPVQSGNFDNNTKMRQTIFWKRLGF